MANEWGVSLGKTNYCLRALLEKGLIKVSNFENSRNKIAYVYILIPQGVEEKSQMTLRFLKLKRKEFDSLKREIDQFFKEVRF